MFIHFADAIGQSCLIWIHIWISKLTETTDDSSSVGKSEIL